MFSKSPPISKATEHHLNSIETATTELWNFIENSLEFYNSKACQCAFPRFRQIVSIDMSDLDGSFYVSETEGFITKSGGYFEIAKTEGDELANQIWTCKKCRSTYRFGWSDFSIYVNRSYLKLIELNTHEIGAAPQTPIPLTVGPFGHKYPDLNTFKKVSLEEFKKYMLELNGH